MFRSLSCVAELRKQAGVISRAINTQAAKVFHDENFYRYLWLSVVLVYIWRNWISKDCEVRIQTQRSDIPQREKNSMESKNSMKRNLGRRK